MTTPHYFSYPQAATEAGINAEQLTVIEKMFRMDYPEDDMLFELHMLRVCHAVKDGRASLDVILREAREHGASAA